MNDETSTFGSVIVTGGSGFIGKAIISRIRALEPQTKIFSLDVRTRPELDALCTQIQCDISNYEEMELLFKNLEEHAPQVLFHTACPPTMRINNERFWKVNVIGTRNLLRCSQSMRSLRAFLYTSTSSVCHDNKSDFVNASEDLPILKPPAQKRFYTVTKAIAEEEILAANRQSGMLTMAFRPSTVYGPEDPLFVGRIIRVALAGNAKYQMGHGRNLYDFCYIDNCVQGHILGAKALLDAVKRPALPHDRTIEGQAFNITDGEHIPFWSFALATSAALGKPVEESDIVKIPYFLGVLIGFLAEWMTWLFTLGTKQSDMSYEGVRFTYIERTLDIGKIKARLGYCPGVSTREGIQRSVEWYLAATAEKDQ